MNITETLLKNLSAGELQRLALELLPKLYKRWGCISHNGGCEGGYRTRKGTPDMWCTTKEGYEVFIQATADSTKGKVFEDTKKSVDKLVDLNKNKNALCISFLNYDPHPEEIEACNEYCEKYSCKYTYYNNHMIARLLDKRYPEIKTGFISLSNYSYITKVSLLPERYYEQIDYVLNKVKWLDKAICKDISTVLKELVKNAIEHGQASTVNLSIDSDSINIIDNGRTFNLKNYSGDSQNNGGGTFALNYFINKYEKKFTYKYHISNGTNIISFNKKREDIILEADSACSLELPRVGYLSAKKSNVRVTIPNHCEKVTLVLKNNFQTCSDAGSILGKVLESISKNYSLQVEIDGEISDMFINFIKSRYEDRINIVKVSNKGT